MSKIDRCYERWVALGSPKNYVPDLDLLADEMMYLRLICTADVRPVIFDWAIDDDSILRAYQSPWPSDQERTWLYAMLDLKIKDRASVMAAFEGYWTPRCGGGDYETSAAA